MKYVLTISSDDPNELARVLAALGAGASQSDSAAYTVPYPPQPTPQMPTPPMPLPGAAAAPAPAGDDTDDGAAPDPNAPAYDSTGLPWDERIHSSSRKTGNDGTWNKRRGGPKGAELAAIETELRARGAPAMPTPAPVAQPMPLPPVAGPVPAMPVPAYTPPPMPVPVPEAVAPVAPAMPLPVAAPVAAAPDPAAIPTDFHQFMTEIGQRTGQPGPNGAPLIDATYLAELAARISQTSGRQLRSVADLAANPDLITYTVQVMQYDGRW
jgi:hypothetical protein